MTITSTPSKILRIGHTPDPDDAYMFYGFATGKVKIDGYEIQHVLEDIQSLNLKAVRSEIEVTAISAAIYPQLGNTYWVMPMGASVGRNYGPIITKIKGQTPKGKKIGIPGKNTTAYLLLNLYTKGFEPVEMKFDEIPNAMKRGELDYGLLIHEAQLTYDSLGLEKLQDLGVEWMKETGLPIPLGLDVIRKDLGKDFALRISAALKKSIEVANQERPQAIQYAIQYGRGIKENLGDKFVGMYVNDDTLEMGEEGEKALNLLFEKGYKAGLLPQLSKIDILRP